MYCVRIPILILNFKSVETTKAAKAPSYHSKYYLEHSFFQVIRMLPWSGTPAKKSQFLAHYKAVNVQKSALFDIEPCMYFFFVNYKKKLKKLSNC